LVNGIIGKVKAETSKSHWIIGTWNSRRDTDNWKNTASQWWSALSN